MIATLTLLSCFLLPAQTADRSQWLMLPHLTPAQELVYRGSIEEQGSGSEVQFTRSYRLHNVAFVLEVSPREAEVAFLTILRLRQTRSNRVEEAAPSSVRLETIRVGSHGQIAFAPEASLMVPLEGPPTVEVGVFLEVPRDHVEIGSSWTVEETNRPPRLWTVAGTETVNATRCVRLSGVQKSEDWDHPRGDGTAWRRQDTLWVAPRLGVAYRVERIIERRPSAQQEVTYKSVVRYELDQRTEYPRGLADTIRREISQARTFTDLAASLLPTPTKYSSEIEALLGAHSLPPAALLGAAAVRRGHAPAPAPSGDRPSR